MTTVQHANSAMTSSHASANSATRLAARDAFLILYAGFTLLPIIAGLDKFFHLLVNWEIYLSPMATQILPLDAPTFMMIVGVVEIAAGLLVLVRPQIGAVVVALWLCGIIVNLLTIPGYFDIALRDFGLALGALALARLATDSAAQAAKQSSVPAA